MLDLNKIFNDTLVKIEDEKFVEQVAEKHIKSAIENIIGDLLGYGGNLKKQIKEELESKLEINLKRFDIPSYNKVIGNAVSEKLDEVVRIQGVEQIKATMDEILKPCEGDYKFSDLIEKFKDYAGEYDDDLSEMSLYIEPRSSLTFIRFDKEEGTREYQCNYSITINNSDNTINSITVDDKDFKDKFIVGNLFGFDDLLFKLYINGSKIILDNGTDPDDYDISFENEY